MDSINQTKTDSNKNLIFFLILFAKYFSLMDS